MTPDAMRLNPDHRRPNNLSRDAIARDCTELRQVEREIMDQLGEVTE